MTNRNNLFLLTLLLTVACDTSEYKRCDSFVEAYDYMEGVLLRYNELGAGEIAIYPYLGHNGSLSCSFFSTGQRQNKYAELCASHNDNGYPHDVLVMNKYDIDGTRYSMTDFDSLAIYSSKAFDSAHAAGTSLADVVRFISFSPVKFIKSGYVSTYDYSTENPLSCKFKKIVSLKGISGEQPYHPIDKLLTDIQAEELSLLGFKTHSPLGYLLFEKYSTLTDFQEFTIQVFCSDGRLLSGTIQIEF